MKQIIILSIVLVLGGCASSTTVTFPEEHPAQPLQSRKLGAFPFSPVLSTKHPEAQESSDEETDHRSYHHHHSMTGGGR